MATSNIDPSTPESIGAPVVELPGKAITPGDPVRRCSGDDDKAAIK